MLNLKTNRYLKSLAKMWAHSSTYNAAVDLQLLRFSSFNSSDCSISSFMSCYLIPWDIQNKYDNFSIESVGSRLLA